MSWRVSRRKFLETSAVIGAGYWIAGTSSAASSKSPNEKLNIGVIGAGGRGAANTNGCASENIVALCDLNANNLAKAAQKYPKAKQFKDWRKMLDQKGFDAVIVSTTDHTHALASVWAMRRGLHVYCEKPLAHSVYEARVMQDTYKKMKVATQMGTQIHATDNYRRVVELVQSGIIGPINEVHVWCTRVGRPPDTKRPTDTPPVPDYLDWDLWLGPAPQRPYHPDYLPSCTKWEQWWEYGNGCLGDMGSHLIDLPFWALKLRDPLTVESQGANHSEDFYPQWLVSRWEHPATADHPALTLTWHDGGKFPESPKEPALDLSDSAKGKKLTPKPLDLTKWHIGVMFIGPKGKIVADYGRRFLLPADKFADFQAPKESIPKSLGHYQEWIQGCKTGSPTLCNFDYSGKLVEHNLLGTVAFRVNKKLQWDCRKLEATNAPEAAKYIRREYRKGWVLEG